MDSVSGTTCPLCATPRTPADARGLAWSSVHTPDGVTWWCPACTRARIGDIEHGLVPLPA